MPETATEKILRLLLLYPRRRWKQAELAAKAGCTAAFASKLTARLVADGIVARPVPQQVLLLAPSTALNRWAALRVLPRPVYIKPAGPKPLLEARLKRQSGYALTLFSAAWHRVRFMRTAGLELYVLKPELRRFTRLLGTRSRTPTNVVLFPATQDVLEGAERVSGLWVVAPVQNYIDLMVAGGSGVRVALELARKYNLLGV